MASTLRPLRRTPAEGRHCGRSWGIDPDTPVILAVGRLVAKKGFDVLVRALPHIHPLAAVVLVGDGAERAVLEELAEQNGGERAHLLCGKCPTP